MGQYANDCPEKDREIEKTYEEVETTIISSDEEVYSTHITLDVYKDYVKS